MPTKTLFQTLELGTGTWTLEVVIADATTHVMKPQTDEDERRAIVPADPWWELAATTMLKGVYR